MTAGLLRRADPRLWGFVEPDDDGDDDEGDGEPPASRGRVREG